MDAWALVGGSALMGVAGLPHCVAMCATPCAMATRTAADRVAFQLARVGGYAAAGAVAAASVAALHGLLTLSPALRPLWTLLQLAALAFGVWVLWQGRWPLRAAAAAPSPSAPPAGWQRIGGPARGAAAGALWIAWPCALSQSALVVASLAPTPAHGALAMAVFAGASSPGLWLAPALLRRVGRGRDRGGPVAPGRGVRIAGALIAVASAWALGHRFGPAVAAWCGAAV